VIAVLCGSLDVAPAQVRPQAEKLFRDGKEFMKRGQIAEACAAFEASEKANHSLATVLSLADCREKNRQHASAWALFLQADSETRTDESKVALNNTARTRAAALEPRLSYLTINVPDESRISGLIVSRDGVEIEHAEWNSAIPIDGGPHEVSGKAPGRESWSTKVVLAPERDRQSVEVPKFKELMQPGAPQPGLPQAGPSQPVSPRPDGVAVGTSPVQPTGPRELGLALTLRIAPGMTSASGDSFHSDLESVGSTSLGVEVAYPFNRHVWLATGASYDPLGTDYELLISNDLVMLHEQVTYMQIPLALRLEAPLRMSSMMVRLFGRAGFSLDIAARRAGTFELGGASGSLSDPELAWYDEQRRFNVGALFGAGVEVGLRSMPSIYVGVDVAHERHLLGEWSDQFFTGGANYRYNATRFGMSLKYQWRK
jgi:hypothetical protein